MTNCSIEEGFDGLSWLITLQMHSFSSTNDARIVFFPLQSLQLLEFCFLAIFTIMYFNFPVENLLWFFTDFFFNFFDLEI